MTVMTTTTATTTATGRREGRARGRTALLLGAMLLAALLLASCAAGPNPAASSAPEAAGVGMGLWHGMISPITFVVSLFNPEVGIYEVRNNGNWYNGGFVLGVAMAFSGGASGGHSASRRKR